MKIIWLVGIAVAVAVFDAVVRLDASAEAAQLYHPTFPTQAACCSHTMGLPIELDSNAKVQTLDHSVARLNGGFAIHHGL